MITLLAVWMLSFPADGPVNELRPDGLVVDWITLGPFPTRPLERRLPDGVNRSGYHTDFLKELGGEANAVPRPDTAVTITTPEGHKRIVKAQRVGPAFESMKLPLFNHILEERHIIEEDYNQAVGYGFCYLKSMRDQKVYGYFGFNDSPKVWLNGKLIHQVWEDERQAFMWQDGIVLDLRKGLNALLIKIDNQRGYWGFELMAYEEQHHLPAVKQVVRRMEIRDLKSGGGKLSLTPVLNPRPIGIQVPVRVELKGEDSKLLASANGRTGEEIAVATPAGYTGRITVTVVPADSFLPELRPVSALAWAGDFRGALVRVRARFAAASKKLDFLSPEWRAIYSGVVRWLDLFFEYSGPVDDWAVKTVRYAGEFTSALEEQRNFVALHPTSAIPVRFPEGQYHVFLPRGFSPARRYPLMIDLHGSSRTERKITFDEPLNVSYVGTYVQLDGPEVIGATPISPAPRDGWAPEYLNAFLAHVKQNFPVDDDRVYMQGGSMGGQGAWDWAVSNPEHFAAIAPRCAFDGHPFRAVRLKNVPAWVFNGEKDLASIAFEPEIMVTAMRRTGGAAELWQFPHLGHSFGDNIDKGALKKWYLRHTRSHEPVPADPVDSIRFGEIAGVVDVPARDVYKLRGRETLSYPQDNLYRAAVKLYQAYRKPFGMTPLRLADGTFLVRSRSFGRDGPMEMLLAPPEGEAVRAVGELETISLPTLRAVKVFLSGAWAEAQKQKDKAYKELDARGYRRTGEEQTLVHVIRTKDEKRIFETLIGVQPGPRATRSHD